MDTSRFYGSEPTTFPCVKPIQKVFTNVPNSLVYSLSIFNDCRVQLLWVFKSFKDRDMILTFHFGIAAHEACPLFLPSSAADVSGVEADFPNKTAAAFFTRTCTGLPPLLLLWPKPPGTAGWVGLPYPSILTPTLSQSRGSDRGGGQKGPMVPQCLYQ